MSDSSNAVQHVTPCPQCHRAVMEKGLPPDYSGQVCLCVSVQTGFLQIDPAPPGASPKESSQ